MKLNDRFVASMQRSDATEHEKTLVFGNLNGLCSYLARTMPQEALPDEADVLRKVLFEVMGQAERDFHSAQAEIAKL
jgi:hypothetical protein